jgi:hypothetical protein
MPASRNTAQLALERVRPTAQPSSSEEVTLVLASESAPASLLPALAIAVAGRNPAR